MRAIINGVEGGNLELFRGSDQTWVLLLTNDDGSVLDITGDTVTLSFYDFADKRNAALFTVTATLPTAAAGLASVAITDANSTLLRAGGTVYAHALRNAGGAGAYTYGQKSVSVLVR